MSQRSRRFLASKEGTTLPTPLDHPLTATKFDPSSLVATMRTALSDHDQGFSLSGAMEKVKDEVSQQVKTHGERYLDSTKQHVTEMTAKVVSWGKEHPMRVAGAVAALIAVSGFLLNLVHGKADKVARIVKVARKAKAGVKARVRSTVKALTSGKSRGRRLATA